MRKNIIIYLASVITVALLCTVSCDTEKKHDDTHISGGRTIYVEQFNGHSIWVANQKLTNDPECPKCKENLRQLITEVVDSIVDDRVVKLLGK